MSDPNQESAFDHLLEQLCIDELGEQEWQALARTIAADEQALHSYIEAVYWRQGLAYLVGRGAASDRPASIPTEVATTEVETPYRIAASASLTERLRGWFAAWGLAATVAFVAGAGLTAIALRRPTEPTQVQVADVSRDPIPIASAQPMPFIQESQLGKVTGLSPDASADGLLRSLQVGQELRCGEVVQFTEGFVRVALNTGPELIIGAPAEFSIIGKESVFVRVGRVTASGTKKVLLQSPLMMAECNDADVLFVAEEDATTNVYVYSGIVTMRSNAQPDSASIKLGMLHAGEGVRVSTANERAELVQVAVAPPVGGVRTWDEVEAKLTQYEQLVLSDRPVAYWPLYHVRRNRRVLDLTQHGFDGQAIGNWPNELNDAADSDERGAYFSGESYIEPDRKPPVNLRTGFTVEGWAKVQGGPAFQSIFTSRWVLDTHTPQRQCLGFTLYAGENDRWQFWSGNGRYGELWNELHAADVPIVRHRWTHVVATFDAEEPTNGKPVESIRGVVRLYVDGALAATDVHELSLLDFEWPARIGAAEFVPNSLTAWLFLGQLRHIAVYDYPLEPERIFVHYETGQPTG